jgi:hypothetical protein
MPLLIYFFSKNLFDLITMVSIVNNPLFDLFSHNAILDHKIS